MGGLIYLTKIRLRRRDSARPQTALLLAQAKRATPDLFDQERRSERKKQAEKNETTADIDGIEGQQSARKSKVTVS